MLSPHDRFRAGLAGLLAELLEAGEEAWMAAHAVECESCRTLQASLQERLPELAADGGHAPPALLSAWLRQRDALTPLERTLIRQHLDSCHECSADLEEMARFARLPLPPRASVQRSTHWRQYSAAGLIGAAALVAVFVTQVREPEVAPRPTVPPQPHTSAPAGVPQAPPPTLTFGDRTRGATDVTLVVASVHALEPQIRIRLPQVFLGAAAFARVTVVGSNGGRVSARDIPVRDIQSGFLLSPDSGNWSPGAYELRVAPGGGRDTSATRRYRFALVPVEP